MAGIANPTKTSGPAHKRHAARTKTALEFTSNATPANNPLDKERPRQAKNTASVCGSSIKRSGASGITADGTPKVKQNPNSAAAAKPSRSLQTSRANTNTARQHRKINIAPAMRNGQ